MITFELQANAAIDGRGTRSSAVSVDPTTPEADAAHKQSNTRRTAKASAAVEVADEGVDVGVVAARDIRPIGVQAADAKTLRAWLNANVATTKIEVRGACVQTWMDDSALTSDWVRSTCAVDRASNEAPCQGPQALGVRAFVLRPSPHVIIARNASLIGLLYVSGVPGKPTQGPWSART